MDFEVIMLDMPNMVRNKNIAHLSATFNFLVHVFHIYISIKVICLQIQSQSLKIHALTFDNEEYI